jgi:hypothetical protein
VYAEGPGIGSTELAAELSTLEATDSDSIFFVAYFLFNRSIDVDGRFRKKNEMQ